jgi:hypothetical protein
VSHLDAHLSVLPLRPEFFDLYLDLAMDFGLPVRLAGAETERAVGFPFRRLAEEAGVLAPDHVVAIRGASRAAFERAVHTLDPGVTEIVLHPAIDSPELRALAPDWAQRVDDHDALVTDLDLRKLLDRAGVERIGYRELRDLQRGG